MRLVVKTQYWLEKEDVRFITQQIKDKKIKITDFCKNNGFSRTYFYETLHGKLPLSGSLLIAFKNENIVLPFRL